MSKTIASVLVGAMGVLALLAFTPGPAAAQPLAVPLQEAAVWLPLPDDEAAADTPGEGDGSTPDAGAEPTPEAQPATPEPQPAEPAAATAPAEGAAINVIGELPSMESKSQTTLIAVTPAA